MSRWFSSTDAAERYASFFPCYPQELFEKMVAFHDRHHHTKILALDVACGTGLSTLPLASHFDNVIGVDASECQLQKADRRFDNVVYRQGKGKDLSFQPDESVDLLLSANSLHLMDVGGFYKEAARVLKPGGTLAICYNFMPNLPFAEGTAALLEFHKKMMNRFYTKQQVNLILVDYGDQFPFPNQEIEGVSATRTWSVSHLMGYVSAMSFAQDLKAFDPTLTELCDLQSKLCSIINQAKPDEQSTDPVIEVEIRYFVRLASKPSE